MRRWASVFTACCVVVLFVGMALTGACSQTPVQPSNSLIGSVPTPTPTGTPVPKCKCDSVTYTFEPGGATPTWGTYVVKGKGESKWRVGFRINVKCTGTGQSNQCEVRQIETGALTFTVDGETGQIVGEDKDVNNFHKVKLGDKWEREYSDALGGDYPNTTTGSMHVELNMEFELKCISSDKTEVKRKFRVTGSVDAQAPAKGKKPVLTNPTITFTPIQP